MNKVVCPHCGGEEFEATALVYENWHVDGYGNWISTLETVDIEKGPHDNDYWCCIKCGEEVRIY